MTVKKKVSEVEVEVKPIPGYPKYYASADGDIYSEVSGKWLKPTVSSTGYYKVRLTTGSGRNTQRVNRLVAMAWLGLPPDDAMVADHINGNKLDNRIANLQWLTQ